MNAIKHAAMSAYRARILSDRFTLLLIAIAVVGAGLVLARQITYGVALWGDSAPYISTARALLAGEGLIELWQGGYPYEAKPPLYPMLLAAGSLGLFDPWDVAGPLNAIFHGLTVLVAGQWLRRHIRSSILAIWGSLAIALALPLITVAKVALADAPFYLLTTLALTRFSAWSEEPRRATLLQAGVFTALACLTRYPGIALIPVFVLLLLIQRNASLYPKAKRIAGYALLSGIPLALYLIRNYISSGTFTPNFLPESQQHGTRTFGGILRETIQYIGSWAAPGLKTDETLHLSLSIIFCFAVIAGFMYFAKTKPEKYPFLLYIPSYFLMITISLGSGATTFGLEERYISMMYIPFIFTLTIAVDGFIRKWSTFRMPKRILHTGGITWITIIITLCFYGWIGYVAKLNEEDIRYHNSSDHFRAGELESEILPWIKNNSTGHIWSNLDTRTTYFRTGRTTNSHGMLPNMLADLPQFIDRTTVGDFLVWTKTPFPKDAVSYTFMDLLSSEGLDFVATLRDGHVLRVSKRTHAEKYAAITSGEPDIVSEFDVYFSGNSLSFVREPCRPFEIQDAVYVHVIPRNVSLLPPRSRRTGFENLEFLFRTTGVIFDGTCMATIPLPDYQITSIFTGVRTTEQHFWRGQFHPSPDMLPPFVFIWSGRIDPSLDTSRLQADYDAITAGDPVVRSFYSVWIDGPYISYTKEPCEEADTTALFFLHVYPVDDADLPIPTEHREREIDFDNLDFVFEPGTGSVRFDGKCVATRMLPDYPIASIRTGQYDARGDVWSVDIPFD